MTKKKTEQLGMSYGKASGKLVKDILWYLITQTNQTICCKCKKEMDRDTFSIEHLIPWLDSEDPVKLFFDLENISFSHLKCNVASARKGNKGVIKHGTATGYKHHKCRCEDCKTAHSQWKQERRTSGKEVR